MPRYTKGKGKLQRKRKWKFHGVTHMSQWLLRTHHDDPLWKMHFQEKALKYKKKKPFLHARSLRAVATKTPKKLAGEVLSELKRQRKGKPVGGGVSETLHWLAQEAAQVTGYNSFKQWAGLGWNNRKIPTEAQIFAKAISATYLKVNERPDTVHNLKRLPEHDTDRYSVWQQPNGRLLVTIHGTRANWGDVEQDIGLAAGKEARSTEVEALFDRLDKAGNTYDIASHSLATQYVVNSVHQKSDKVYLYNSASSPLMSSDYLTRIANDKNVTHFINPSDPISEAVFDKMTPDTITKSYVAPYSYSQLSSHSVSQWHKNLEDVNP